LRAGLRVGEDAAGVVIDIGGNESGTEDGQKEKYPDSPALPHGDASSYGGFIAVFAAENFSSLTITGKTQGPKDANQAIRRGKRCDAGAVATC
jgi:hypothetical protein